MVHRVERHAADVLSGNGAKVMAVRGGIVGQVILPAIVSIDDQHTRFCRADLRAISPRRLALTSYAYDRNAIIFLLTLCESVVSVIENGRAKTDWRIESNSI